MNCFQIKRFLFITSFLVFTLVSSAQKIALDSIPKRSYTTHSIENNLPPIIDGLIDEKSWNVSEWQTDFIENRPDENTSPSFQTKFKIVYDSNFLYVAIKAFDSIPEKIDKRMTRRDGFGGDWVEVHIDSYHDKRTGFSFTTTASGVKGDEFISNNGNNWDESWNPIWYNATQINDDGWTAEIKIPFSQLKFGEKEEQIWGLQIHRRFFRNEERSVWQRIPQDSPGWVSEFGILRGLYNIKPQRQLEIQPFTTQQFDTYEKEENNPFRDGSDFKLNGGLDAKIGITNDLTLDVTINPDFGQVEADPGAIALDGFQIFFDERRPFFVENKNIFDFRFANGSDNLFYSRRIGGSPHKSPDTDDNTFVDQPTNSTILGAAKFSGKTKNGWSVGLLESVTNRMFAKIDKNGTRTSEIVEPLTNYLVSRVQKDFNNRNSYIGGIFTATNRDLGTDFNTLVKSAYTGGFDFRHSWKNRNYYFEGNVIASHIKGSKEAIQEIQESNIHLFQRVDAGHVEVDENRTSLTGTGGKIEIGKDGGGNWRYSTGVNWRSPELELNDIGFLRKADEIRQFSRARYNFNKPTKVYRRAGIGVFQSSRYDFDGNYNNLFLETFGFINWKNNWWTEMGINVTPHTYDNSYLRGGPRFRLSNNSWKFLFFGSDRRKKFYFTLGHVDSKEYQNTRTFRRYVMRLNYQPLDALSLSLNTEFVTNDNKIQYVDAIDYNNTKRYLLGNVAQETLSITLRMNYNINPNLTIQYYGQPFISRGKYSDFNFVNNAISKDISDRVTFYNQNQISFSEGDDEYRIDENLDNTVDYTFGNPDFSSIQFRSNLVLRWEYIPGSELYFVWSQGITGSENTREDLTTSLYNQTFKQKLDNTFLLKFTYRFIL